MSKPIGSINYYKGIEIRGWFSDDEKEWYKKQAQKIKNGKFIEIGVYQGASLLSIADILKNNKTKVYAIDPWELNSEEIGYQYQNKEFMTKSRKLFESINQKYKLGIEIIQDMSQYCSGRFKDNSIDMVFLDGDHTFITVLKELELYWPKVKKGGMIAGDDYTWESVKQAVDKFSKDKMLKLDLYKKIIWSIKKPAE